MSIKSRLRKLENKANSNADVAKMLMDVFFPDWDEATGQDVPMSTSQVLQWLQLRESITADPQQEAEFQDTLTTLADMNQLCMMADIAPNYPDWPQELEPYRDSTDCIIAATLRKEYGISP